MNAESGEHIIHIAGLERRLPLLEVAPGTRIAILNILGDVALVRAAAEALATKLQTLSFDALVTPEAKSIPLAHELATLTDRPYVVLRKQYKAYMGQALSATTQSITTGQEQTLYLDQRDVPVLQQRRVVLLDDVISSGSTLAAMRALMARVEAHISGEAAIFTEGDAQAWPDVMSLGHLPIF